MIKIQGIVFEDKTNEKLIGTNIFLSDSGVAITNNKGFFSFNVSPGSYEISASMVGYKKQTKIIPVQSTDDEVNIFFRLEPYLIEIPQVTVNGDKFYEKVKYKTYELQQGDLRRIPQFGEADALRALQALPSLVSLNDFSTQLFLRGGNFAETLISIDNVPVYNPYHLGSFFSMFNADIIDKQILYPSNYPNKYGGYLSGVLDIQTKAGNFEKTNASISVGVISSKAFIETPLSKGSLILSARRTYLDLLASIIDENLFPYYFYDVYGKYNYPIDEQNHLSISVLHSRDNFKMFDSLYQQNINVSQEPTWGNNLYNFEFSHLINSQVSIDGQIYYSSSLFNAKGESIYNSIPTQTEVNNKIQDISASLNLNYSFTGHYLQAGIEFKKINLNYDWIIGESELTSFGFELEDTFFDYAPKIFAEKQNEMFYNIYLHDKIILSQSFNFTVGLRNCNYAKLGMNLISPSININYQVGENLDLIFGYGKYFQNLFVIKDQNSILLDPFSVYFLPKNKEQLANSNNFSINMILSDFIFGSILEISSYYNLRKNLASSYPHQKIHYNFEDGYSTGLEFLLKKNIGNMSGWLSYSFSRSIKSNINYDYFNRIDRTNTIKFLFNLDLSESWFLTSFWTYATGTPYTPTLGQYIGESEPSQGSYFLEDEFNLYPIMGGKNTRRANAYHRLDLGINGSFFWGTLFIKPYLQILNVYNSPNETPYKKSDSSDSDTERGSSIIPTIGITVDF
ncbi:MAG: TonB-dependent receptor [Ignavibacteriae bacterium]|nr:TonB-dependent receptor [Ignavibacteriota bacterium]